MAAPKLQVVPYSSVPLPNPPPDEIARGGGGGDNGDMNARLTALETRLDTLLPSLATRSDTQAVEGKVLELETRVVRWVAGIGVATVTVLISVMGFLFSRIDTKPTAPSAPAPLIITVPQVATPLPPPAVASPPAPAPQPQTPN